MAFDAGLNFRRSSGYVTDPAGTTYVQDNDDYPTSRGGWTFGYTNDLPTDNDRDRDSGIDARLAGVHFYTNNDTGGSAKSFRIDLDNTGNHDVHIASGDATAAQTQYWHVKDNTTSLIDETDGTSTPSADWEDATGTVRTSASDWVTNETAETHNFSSTIFVLEIGGDHSSATNTTISHVRVVEVAAGATPVGHVFASQVFG